MKVSILKDSAIMSWLAYVIFKYKVHVAGRTIHEWVTGHRCDQPVAGFAEKVHFKFTTDQNLRNKMNTEWCTGYFVGVNGKTTEYLVAKSLANGKPTYPKPMIAILSFFILL